MYDTNFITGDTLIDYLISVMHEEIISLTDSDLTYQEAARIMLDVAFICMELEQLNMIQLPVNQLPN
ncbi:MAG: hypothetical protein HZB57_05840 [Gammaproteobacteria bacterium]|nr:hypothetical protein [Gammaproteobacteria bacterium]